LTAQTPVNSNYPRLRTYALEKLARPLPENAWNAVLHVARDDWEIPMRSEARKVLQRSPDHCRKHLSIFMEMLSEEDSMFQAYLNGVLKSAGLQKAIPALLNIVDNEYGPKSSTRRANAIYHLGSQLGADPQIEVALRNACRDNDLRVRRYAVAAVGASANVEIDLKQDEHLKTKSFIPELIDAAGHQDGPLAKTAIDALRYLGPQAEAARPTLLNVLRERKDLRFEAICALASGKRDYGLAPALLPYLREEEGEQIVNAILTSLATEKLPKDALQPVLHVFQSKRLRSALQLEIALTLLDQYGSDAKDVVPDLVEILFETNGQEKLQQNIARSLEKLDPNAGKEARRYIEDLRTGPIFVEKMLKRKAAPSIPEVR
jgi:hypothetical protein